MTGLPGRWAFSTPAFESVACLPVIPPEVEAVREIARSPGRWAEAHAAFSAVRNLVLLVEKRSDERPRPEHGILYLAENVAKVTYNASAPRAPFDHDAGWWIAKNARWMVDHSADAGLGARVWAALTRQ
jgi:hypothetical protein